MDLRKSPVFYGIVWRIFKFKKMSGHDRQDIGTQEQDTVALPLISPEQALQYAPDDSSVKAAKKLAAVNHWQSLHQHTGADGHSLIWGEIRGSSLYQSSIILTGNFHFACNCPSFKRPCKHGLALLMTYAHSQHAFVGQERLPDWVSKHLDKTSEAAAKKAEKAAKPAKVVDETAQAKRVAARENKVEAGLQELQLWLDDLIRSGLAHAKTLSYSHFQRMKQRLIDGQASGLAALVDELQSALAQTDWQQLAAAQAGRLQLLLSAYQRLDSLPDALQADVRSLIGWNTPQDQVLATTPTSDRWLVVGSRELETEHHLRYRRQWLWAVHQPQAALVLTFTAGFQPLPPPLPLARQFDGALCWYPGAWRQRALIKEQGMPENLPLPSNLGYPSLAQALAHQAEALALNPFLAIFPMLLDNVIPQYHDGRWWLCDHRQQAVPLQIQGESWPLLALSGGHPLTMFGEWDGQRLTGLCAWQDDEIISL